MSSPARGGKGARPVPRPEARISRRIAPPNDGGGGGWGRRRRRAAGGTKGPAHRSPRYRCFLPDLAGFAVFCCRDPPDYLAESDREIKSGLDSASRVGATG